MSITPQAPVGDPLVPVFADNFEETLTEPSTSILDPEAIWSFLYIVGAV